MKPKTQGKNIKPGNKRTYKKPTEKQHNFDAESIVSAKQYKFTFKLKNIKKGC